NAPFQLALRVQKDIPDIAEKIAEQLKGDEIQWTKATNGFVNIKIKKEVWIEELKNAINPDYGEMKWGEGKRVLLEYVSANPTGPLHVASARAATFGDSLSRILKSQGFTVNREYYFNDSGNQVELLGKSIELKIKELHGERVDYPANAYMGDYITKLAKNAIKENISNYIDFGVKKILKMQKDTLERFRVKFDDWISEVELKKKGMADRVIEELSLLEPSPIEKKDGALWFISGERERVFIS
ncbi:unnamed protein product, partial [marine sediment metagenome]